MARTKRYTKEEVIKAIEEAQGILMAAAKILGCTRRTVYVYIKKYATVKKAYEDANESMLDYAENQLLKNIQQGKEASIFFYLKCKGKSRGYIERLAIQTANVDLDSLTDSQLKRVADGEDLVTVLADKG